MWQHVLVAIVLIVATAAMSATLFGGRNADAVPAASEPPRDVTVPTSASARPVDTQPSNTVEAVAPDTEFARPDDTALVPSSTFPPIDTPDDARRLDTREVLASISIELEDRTRGYDRDLFAVWIDADGDGCDTRSEVLLAENLAPAEAATPGCVPIPGLWRSTYDAIDVTDPSQLDVDHLVSLKEAWDSGAWAWTPERRIAYANDLSDGRTLIAVSATSNRSKGDRDPSNWIPEDDGAVCPFVGDWIAVKARWSMSMDQSEHGRLGNLIDDHCRGLTIEPWPEDAPADRS
jgi:hypothetical protein